jgi:hypothetical protein
MGVLQILACDDSGKKDESRKITLQINPTSVNIDLKNRFSDQRGLGTIGSEQKFTRAEPGVFSFKTLLDSTGVIDGAAIDVHEVIKKINYICYNYNGKKHEPNKIVVIWGDFYFKGNLTKLNIAYKLFSPDGKILRAELDFSFTQFIGSKEEAKIKNQSSPDITHIVTVVAGSNIPDECNKIYKNNKIYPIIARINNLTDFRNVKPGIQLVFPPLK